MVYDWAPYEDECYRLFIEEGKSVADVHRYVKEKYGFEPSVRGYEVQFKRWGFPNKRGTPEQVAQISKRVKQLWENNTSRTDMLKILKDEGFRVSEPQLRRLRQKNGWLLRTGPAYGRQTDPDSADEAHIVDDAERQQPTVSSNQVDCMNTSFESSTYEHSSVDVRTQYHSAIFTDALPAQSEAFSSTAQDDRANRLAALQIRSNDLRTQKKRRRRIQSYGGLDPDPPGPPRFASETTLDESKAFLHLSNQTYQSVRAHFQSICEETGVTGKATSEPSRWAAAKERLIAEHEHVRREFHGPWDSVAPEQKALALDAICMSVAKHLRRAGKSMTIIEAKTVLGLNPSDARHVRAQLYGFMAKDNFISMVESGLDHWNELKRQWYQGSLILQQVMGLQTDQQKKKAFDRLASDVLKRFRDDLTKKQPDLKASRTVGPGPGPVFKGFDKDKTPIGLISAQVTNSSVRHDSLGDGNSDGYDPPAAAFPEMISYTAPARTRKSGHVAMGIRKERTPEAERPQNRLPKLKPTQGRMRQSVRSSLASQNDDGPPAEAQSNGSRSLPDKQSDPPPGSSNSHRSALQQEQMDQRQREAIQHQAYSTPPLAPPPTQESTRQFAQASTRHSARARQTAAREGGAQQSQSSQTRAQVQVQIRPPQPRTAESRSIQAQPAQPSDADLIAALFRAHPSSTFRPTKHMSFAMLATRTLEGVIKKCGSSFHDVAGRHAVVKEIQGMMSDDSGGEAGFRIQDDAELEAYLSVMDSARCIFVVTLESANA